MRHAVNEKIMERFAADFLGLGVDQMSITQPAHGGMDPPRRSFLDLCPIQRSFDGLVRAQSLRATTTSCGLVTINIRYLRIANGQAFILWRRHHQFPVGFVSWHSELSFGLDGGDAVKVGEEIADMGDQASPGFSRPEDPRGPDFALCPGEGGGQLRWHGWSRCRATPADFRAGRP